MAQPAPPAPKPAAQPQPDNLSILLYGPTGSGKTAQIGEIAEYYYALNKKRTRLYSADKGGWNTIKPYVDLGIIDAVPFFGDPWIWINHAVKGDRWQNGEWLPGIDKDIAMYAFEGMTSMADALMDWMADAGTKGTNIGGGASFSFMSGTEGSEKALKIGSNNMAHYSVAQQRVYNVSTFSQMLPGTILWTAGDRRGEDDANGGVVGPQVAGKAMTGEAPRWFKYTWRITTEVMPGMDTKHVLYLDHHSELNAKMAKGIANSRVPLSGGGKDGVEIPQKIEPASVVQVLKLLDQRQDSAKDAIRKRLGLP